MNTTNKVFFMQVQEHIIDALCEDYFESTPERLQATVNAFHNWYGAYEQKRTPSKYKAFKEWLMGLPSEINIEYRHFAISEILEKWFTSVGMEYKERDGSIECEYYLHLVTREFLKVCKKHNITSF